MTRQDPREFGKKFAQQVLGLVYPHTGRSFGAAISAFGMFRPSSESEAKESVAPENNEVVLK